MLRASGTLEPIDAAGDPPLGLFDRRPYTGGSVHLAPGDTLFLYTDGVPEATNAALDDFTNERLVEVLRGSLSCRNNVS
jgi:sigma-B regulation protein RsbU (phosphoserine phosphatase)